ncbi:MAG TPA: HNH endonuclease signature motif containing protein, partial [Nitrososphaerales archaeon]|nr:HNH endonuclease signature motif containing protein [Nitrososphaerales archaeon]
EVDHIIEIADGGDEFDLSNTQTICRRHHRLKTAVNNRLRAQRRKLMKMNSPDPVTYDVSSGNRSTPLPFQTS